MVKKRYKLIHVMADGTERDDITGYVIPAGHQVYNILKSINEKQLEASWCSISFRNTTSSYTAVSNEFLDDDELSFKAKGILMVILRNKENWRVYPEEIAKRSKDKVSAVRTGLKELEEHQYIRTYKKISKRSDGLQRYRFCADRKISDDIFEQLKQKLDQELAD